MFQDDLQEIVEFNHASIWDSPCIIDVLSWKDLPFLYFPKYRFSSAMVGAMLRDRMIKQSLSGVSTKPCGANSWKHWRKSRDRDGFLKDQTAGQCLTVDLFFFEIFRLKTEDESTYCTEKRDLPWLDRYWSEAKSNWSTMNNDDTCWLIFSPDQ